MAEKKTLLIVDDEAELTDMLKLHFEHKGYNVLTAYDGEEAVNRIKNESPDLIVLDINLPKIKGIQVFQTIPSRDGRPVIPVVILTARGELESFFEDVQADAFICKPFEFEELFQTVDSLLSETKLPLVFLMGRKKTPRARALKKAFRKGGFDLEVVADFSAFSKSFDDHPAEFVIMDYAEAGTDVKDLIKNICGFLSRKKNKKAVPEHKTHICVYTYSGFDCREKAISAGAHSYIGKPESHEKAAERLKEFYKNESNKGIGSHPIVFLIDLVINPNTKGLRDRLINEGFRVEIVENMRAFRTSARENLPDIILMEYMQEGTSLREFILNIKGFFRELREKILPPQDPQIFVFTFTDPLSHEEETLKAGADMYTGMLKNADDLVTTIKEYLVDQKQEKEKEKTKRDRLRGGNISPDEGLGTGDVPDVAGWL